MKIINNFGRNHADELKELAGQSEKIYIISPFISAEEINALLGNVRAVIVITTVNSYGDATKARNILELERIRDFCEKQKIELHICKDDKLHAKIYAFYDKDEKPVGIVISSANATRPGLYEKHECGVLIGDAKRQDEIVNSFEKKSDEIPLAEFHGILAKAEKYKAENPERVKRPSFNPFDDEAVDNEVDITSDVNLLPVGVDIRYFIKPIGNRENPYTDEKTPGKNLYFPDNGRPKAIRVGDILICHAVGNDSKVIGYYRVESKVLDDKTNERYPYYVEGECLSCKFTSGWGKGNVSLIKLAERFKADNPALNITHKGGRTLGALKRGAGYVRITEEFAKFILNGLK